MSALLLALAAALPQPPAEPVALVRVTFDRDRITSARTDGSADLSTGRAVTIDDPVRIASISKLVLALGVLRLVEEGRLDLDSDVSRWLGYAVRNPAFPERPISLRLLLSHRSGLTDNVRYALPFDADIKDTMADPKAWDSEHAPGSFFRYTNLNFPLIASVMERATGERFDRLMQRLILAPLKLDACYNWATCTPAAAGKAVVLYSAGKPVRDDNKGSVPPCGGVNLAQDGSCDLSLWVAGRNGAIFSPRGLRISASGLARIGQLLLNKGEVDGVRLLSERSIATLFTPLWTLGNENGVTGEADSGATDTGFTCTYGLAIAFTATRTKGCADDPFGDGVRRIGHAGDAYGLKSGLWIDPVAGTGVAYFATNVAEGRGVRSAFTPVEEDLAKGDLPR